MMTNENQTIFPTLHAATEKPLHYTYLKEFRVEACPLFKQHQCHQHRPYTCFYWHFANQRRRRPIRRRDGTFNYSADIYCSKYDENTGLCPDGDECPFLHRVAGDVERKYHLRYYKTALCVHSTDAKGQCVKNGPHCAFAHNAEDLRVPIFDIREIQGPENSGELLENKDRTSFVVEDPVWQDQEHVLACYKTEPCKKPPRLCRQGYACPFYHNSKDRRRPPGNFKYRSTPCPNAKASDEWADPDCCETGETCQYCHTRTEQQFHPEIYKSTKCNDMLQHGYCPRGPFCAFAHNDDELHNEREIRKPPTAAATAALKANEQPTTVFVPSAMVHTRVDIPEAPHPPNNNHMMRSVSENAPVGSPNSASLIIGSAPSYSSVLKQRNQSGPKYQGLSGQSVPQQMSNYAKAPGFERGQQSPTRTWTPDGMEGRPTTRIRTTSLTQQLERMDLGYTVGGNTPPTPNSMRSNSFGSYQQHYQQRQGIEALVANVLEDLSMDELPLATISEKEEINHGNDMKQNGPGMYGSSAPVTIPGSKCVHPGVLSPLTHSSGSSGIGGSGLLGAAMTDGPFPMSGSFGNSNLFSESAGGNSGQILDSNILLTELQRAKEELVSHRTKLHSWEDGLKQARQACEAWKQESEQHRLRANQLEIDKSRVTQERDVAVAQLELLKGELIRLQQSSVASSPSSNLYGMDLLSGSQLEQCYTRLRSEMEKVEGQLRQRGAGPMCGRCGRHVNGTTGNGTCPLCSPATKNGLSATS